MLNLTFELLVALAFLAASPLCVGMVYSVLRGRELDRRASLEEAGRRVSQRFPLVILLGAAIPAVGILASLAATPHLASVHLLADGEWWRTPAWAAAGLVVGVIGALVMRLLRAAWESRAGTRSRPAATGAQAAIAKRMEFERLRALVTPKALAAISVTNVLEELMWRSFALGILLPLVGAPVWVSVVVAAVGYGVLVHYGWGAREVTVHTLMGLVYGAVFVLSGGSLLVASLTHVAFNVVSLRQLSQSIKVATGQAPRHF
jgi:hypothetical protein